MSVAPVDGGREVARLGQRVGVGECRDRAGEQRVLGGGNGQRGGRQFLIGNDASQGYTAGSVVDAERLAIDVENGVVGVRSEGPAQAPRAGEDRKLVAKRCRKIACDSERLGPEERDRTRDIELIVAGGTIEPDLKGGRGTKRRLAALQDARVRVTGAHLALVHRNISNRPSSPEGPIWG